MIGRLRAEPAFSGRFPRETPHADSATVWGHLKWMSGPPAAPPLEFGRSYRGGLRRWDSEAYRSSIAFKRFLLTAPVCLAMTCPSFMTIRVGSELTP